MDETVDITTKDLKDKITSTKKFVREFDLRLRGHTWAGSGDEYVDTGQDLVGSELADKLVGLLLPFCQEGNLISSKDDETYYEQEYELDSMANELLFKDDSCPERNQRLVLKIFKSTLLNIWDIMKDSKSFLARLLGAIKIENNGVDESA